MLLSEPGDGLRKDGPGGSCEAGDLQVADHVVALPVELALSVLNLRQDGVCSLCQQRARRRQPYAPAVRFDQPLTDIALEFAELLRDR